MVDKSLPMLDRVSFWARLKRDLIQNWRLYVLILPAITALILFRYAPMYGLQIAFKDFKPAKGIIDSRWVGLKHFKNFINSYQFDKVLRNTISISVWNSYMDALLYIRNPELVPLQLVLREILVSTSNDAATAGSGEDVFLTLRESVKYGVIVVSTLPLMMAYPFLQKYFNKGVMIGAVKG